MHRIVDLGESVHGNDFIKYVSTIYKVANSYKKESEVFAYVHIDKLLIVC